MCPVEVTLPRFPRDQTDQTVAGQSQEILSCCCCDLCSALPFFLAPNNKTLLLNFVSFGILSQLKKTTHWRQKEATQRRRVCHLVYQSHDNNKRKGWHPPCRTKSSGTSSFLFFFYIHTHTHTRTQRQRSSIYAPFDRAPIHCRPPTLYVCVDHFSFS